MKWTCEQKINSNSICIAMPQNAKTEREWRFTTKTNTKISLNISHFPWRFPFLHISQNWNFIVLTWVDCKTIYKICSSILSHCHSNSFSSRICTWTNKMKPMAKEKEIKSCIKRFEKILGQFKSGVLLLNLVGILGWAKWKNQHCFLNCFWNLGC